MELRRVISFGKSSFVVSLPKAWARSNNISKGDVMHIEEREGSLVLSPRKKEQEADKKKSITIQVGGKSIAQIKREIIPAYINNYKTMYIEGNDLSSKAEEIQKILHDLMALEVISIENSRITAKDFLNMAEISLRQLIKKMDKITRAMLGDVTSSMSKATYENVLSRDSDVNRLSYLIFRAIRYGASHPAACSNLFDMEVMELFNLWTLTARVERIADDAKRMARYVCQLKLQKEAKEQVNTILSQLKQNYEDMMDAYYSQDKSKAHKVTARKEKVISMIDSLHDAAHKTRLIPILSERMKTLAITTHGLGRAVYE